MKDKPSNNIRLNSSWSEDLIKNIGCVTVGGTPSTSIEKYWNEEIPWMSSGDVHLKRIYDVPGRISELGLCSSNATLVEPPAVAIGLAGQGKTRGTVALVLLPLCTNQSVALIQGKKDKLDIFYLFYNLEFRYQELRSRSVGGGRAGLSKSILETLPIPIPIIKEQQAIASVLSAVDRAIEQTEKLIAKQQRIKTGLMQDLLTKGIDKHGNIRSEETHEFKDSKSILGRIPLEWTIQEIASVLIQPPKNGYSPSESEIWNGIYILGLGCLTGEGFKPRQLKYAPVNNRRIEAALLKDGDFLISRSNTRALVGFVGIFKDIGEKCIYPDLMMRLQFSNQVLNNYMEQVFMSRMMRRQIENIATGTSGSMVKINAKAVKKFIFGMPSLCEQKRITSRLKFNYDYILKLKLSLEKLYLQKTGLMQDLLTGKVRVTDLLDQTSTTST
ncbi:MAG: hypothetical protein HC836_14010 [Richelia sp. RM2_1_2]|nr:hypothetical protein [Richelia sp. RM2_1_2]